MIANEFQPYFDFYHQALHQRGLEAQTIHSHLFDLRQFLGWLALQEGLTPETVSTTIAQAYANHLQTERFQIRPGKYGHYSSTTVRRKIGVLRDFYTIMQSGAKHESLP